MKKTALFSKALIAVIIAATVICAAAFTLAENSYADVKGKGYQYKVTVYAGIQGEFEGGKKVWSKMVDADEEITISEETTGFKLTNDEYYVRGFREAGHDNDEQLKSVTLHVDEDTSFEVAYGLAGGMVKYVIRYVDEDGEELRHSDTYYGMKGDKPVVSYKYVNNYRPQAYHVKKTLSDNEDDNVFTFTYSPIGDADQNGNGQQNNTAANPGRDDANINAAATAPNGDNVNDDAADDNDGTADIEDQDGPLAGTENDGNGNGSTDIGDNKSATSSPAGKVRPGIMGIIGGSAALAVAFIAVVATILKRRGGQADIDA